MSLRVTGILGLDGTGWQQTLLRAEGAASRFANNIRFGLGARLAGLFSVGALGAFARKTVEAAGRLTDLSARTSESVEDLQRLEHTLKQNGSSLEDLIGFWERLNRARAGALKDPEGPQASAFASLGVSGGDLAGKTANDLTRQIALKIQASPNVEAMSAALQQVGGRGVGNLVASFRAGLFQMNEDIRVMTAEQAEILDEMDDKWSALGNELMAEFAPILVRVIDLFKNWWFGMHLMTDQIVGITQSLAAGFTALFKALFSGNITGALKAFGAAFKENFSEATADLEKSADEEYARRTSESAAREARIKDRKRRGPLEFEAFDAAAGQKAKQASAFQGDSLISAGNFLGSNRGALQSIAERQLQLTRESVGLLRQIATNTSQPGDDTQFPTT